MAPAHGRDIPRRRWAQYFEALSRDYQGTDATIEVLPPSDEPQILVYRQPFADISGEETVTIRLGGGIVHEIERATGICEHANTGGLGTLIVFEAAGGPSVRLTLAAAMERSVGGSDPRERDFIGSDPAFVGGSAGAAGGSVAAGDGRGAPGVGDDYGPQITFGSSDDMGGVASVGGGSMGDQDLSGRRSYDITADVYGGGHEDLLDDAGEGGGHAGPGSETSYSGAASFSQAQGSNSAQIDHHKPDVIDGGGDQGVIDTTADPIDGTKLDPANDASDSYVEGEVGAQAERELDELMDDHPELRGPLDEDSRRRGRKRQ